jgi:hypothetical protein
MYNAESLAALSVFRPITSADYDDEGLLLRHRQNPFCDGKSIQLWHPQVQKNSVRHSSACSLKRLLAVKGDSDIMSYHAQQYRAAFGVVLVVVHYENTQTGLSAICWRSWGHWKQPWTLLFSS